jgi:hypothetical protein
MMEEIVNAYRSPFNWHLEVFDVIAHRPVEHESLLFDQRQDGGSCDCSKPTPDRKSESGVIGVLSFTFASP